MIREATVEDVPEVLAVINRAYVVEAPFIRGDRVTAADIRDTISTPSSAYLVMLDSPGPEASIIGALKIELNGKRAHVGPIAVEPARQGTGVGKAIVAAAEEYGRERGNAHLDLCVRIQEVRSQKREGQRARPSGCLASCFLASHLLDSPSQLLGA